MMFPPKALAADSPAARWPFDAKEGRQDAIRGHHELVPGVRGMALRSDEFETAIECEASSVPTLKNGAFTVEAWIAPRTFPWNYCPIIEQRDKANGFYFGINYQGQLQLHVSLGGTWVRCESPTALPGLDENVRFAGENRISGKKAGDFGEARPTPSVPLLKWTHVAGTLDHDGSLRLFINGEPAGGTKAAGNFTPAATKLVLARTTEPVLPPFLARAPANKPNFCSLDGLLDEVKIHDRALTEADLRAQFKSVKLANAQPLQPRRMPTAQDQPGGFGAFYTRFRYDKDWDRTRRFGETQDVFVRFDNNPCTFVCWNGTIYPVFYSEGGKVGQMFEAYETWSQDGCHEAMMDRQSKYSSWPWFLPCWHHWPTAQLIDSDGSVTFIENGRPKSSCLTNGWGYGKAKGDSFILTPNSLTRFTLTGMTDGSTASLVPLARSYHQPPAVSVATDGFHSEGFSVAEKAFILDRQSDKAPAKLELSIAASADSPLVNPAFVVRKWGEGSVSISINGKPVPFDNDCRVGFRETPAGRDLILWLRLLSESTTDLSLTQSAG